jgi:hypothetical protein
MSPNTMQELECFISALTDEIERLSGLMKLGTQNLKKSLNVQPSSRDPQPVRTSNPLTLEDALTADIVVELVRRWSLEDKPTPLLHQLRRWVDLHLQEREP